MFCPVCKSVELILSERQGIEIDYCPACRGIWLDRGELDKLIERSVQLERGIPVASAQAPQALRGNASHRDFEHSGHGNQSHGSQKPHQSFWRELFD